MAHSSVPWPCAGIAGACSDAWTPTSPGRGGPARQTIRLISGDDWSRGIRSPEEHPGSPSSSRVEPAWDASVAALPKPLSKAQLGAVFEELSGRGAGQDLRAVWGLSDRDEWPRWTRFTAALEAHGLDSEDSRPNPCPRSVQLEVSDWRFGIEGAWSPVLRALLDGRRLWVIVDSACPELFSALWEALAQVGADRSGIAAWPAERGSWTAAALASRRVAEVCVRGTQATQKTWSKRLAQVPQPLVELPRQSLPFGHGLNAGHSAVPARFQTLVKPAVHMPVELVSPGNSAERPPSPEVRAWIAHQLRACFGTREALGGWAAWAPGWWVIPAQLFSESSECLLELWEGLGNPRSGSAAGAALGDHNFPIFNPSYRKDLEDAQRFALGKEATLLATGSGSLPWGQDAMMSRQALTNVRPQTARSLAAWGTPTLALVRGNPVDLPPLEAPGS